MGRCGKPNCSCKDDPPILHGPYYQWTGIIQGKRTSRTLSREDAKECAKRIKNYQKLMKELDSILEESKENAPWEKLTEYEKRK